MSDVEVFTRDRSSGRVIDQAEVDVADSHDLCGRCFPQPANDTVPG